MGLVRFTFRRASLRKVMKKPLCLLACLLACLPACLLACLPACLLACLPACLLACLPACLLAGLPACRLACLPACLLACLLACLPPCPPCSPSVHHQFSTLASNSSFKTSAYSMPNNHISLLSVFLTQDICRPNDSIPNN